MMHGHDFESRFSFYVKANKSALGMSYRELEKATGVNKESIRRICNGQNKAIPIRTVHTLVNFFTWEKYPYPTEKLVFEIIAELYNGRPV